MLVAEEPGVGLGARFAGLDGPDPGLCPRPGRRTRRSTPPAIPTAMWALDPARRRDRGGLRRRGAGLLGLGGAVAGVRAGFLLIDDFVLTDLRNAGHELDIPFGALSPRLTA